MTEELAGGDAAPEQPAAPESNSISNTIARAFEQAGVSENTSPEPEQAEAQPVEDSGPARGPDGKFVAKDQGDSDAQPAEQTIDEAPSRFSADAKAEWEGVPASVKGEVSRAFREMESGLTEYQQKMEPLKPWLDMTQGDAKELSAAMERYWNLEQIFQQDPLKGLDAVCRNLGTDLQTVAAQVAGQTPDEKTQQQSEYVRGLEQKVAQLEQAVSGVTEAQQTQQRQSVERMVAEFADSHERFDELQDQILEFVGKGYDLEKAYDYADKLNPSVQPAPVPEAQTRKATLSVQGAPGTGSNPDQRQRSGSAREAVERAFSAVGF